MEKQTSLSLPKDLLLKVKHLAIDKNTSVSGSLTQTLEESVRKNESYQKAKERRLMVMETWLAWDAMIIQSAGKLGCGVLWSKDFNHGQSYGEATVMNPFVEG